MQVLFLALIWATTSAPVLWAATAAPVVRIGVDVVQIDAVVTDKKGRHVDDLTAADFEIYEDGKKQTVTHCEYVRLSEGPPASPAAPMAASAAKGPDVARAPNVAEEAPKRVPGVTALVVDDYGLARENVERVRQAARRFIDRHSDLTATVAVARTGQGTRPDFTTDRRQLDAAIDTLRAPTKLLVPDDLVPGVEVMGPFQGAGDPEFRAQWHRRLILASLDGLEAAIEALATRPGRRVLVLFSDRLSLENHDPMMRRSFDPWVIETMERLRERANRASIVMYTVTASGVRTFAATAADTRARNTARTAFQEEEFTGLHVFPEATGGLWIKNTNDLDHALDTIASDQAGYYLLAYMPDKAFFATKDGRPQFRKIRVKVKGGGLRVRSRSGFLGVADEPAP